MRQKQLPQKVIAQDLQPGHSQYRTYNAESRTRALELVKNGVSVYKASKMTGVPRQTISDHIRGKVKTAKSGPARLFTENQEKNLEEHIKQMALIGYGYTKKDVQLVATDYAVYLGLRSSEHDIISKRWVTKFVRRWPDLKVGKPRGLQISRAKAVTKEAVSEYFKNLRSILTEHNLEDAPEHIWNIDESGVSTEHSPPQIVGPRGHQLQVITSERSSTTTVIAGCSAVGTALPPYIIHKGKRLTQDLAKGATPGAALRVSETGWSNSLLFQDYLQTHFLRYRTGNAGEQQKTLLLYDGHRSHVCKPLVEWAKEKGLILFVLPPHSSHLTQPLDVGVFGPFKNVYNQEATRFMRSHPGQNITRYDLTGLICTAYQLSHTPKNITHSFRKVGVHPFNADAIPAEKFLVNSIFSQDSQPSSNQPFFSERIPKVTDAKKTSSRKQLNLGGQAITEGEVFEEITAQVPQPAKSATKKPKPVSQVPQPTKSATKKPKPVSRKRVSEQQGDEQGAKCVRTDSPRPGPSGIQIQSSQPSSVEDTLDESDLCCVCNKFSPPGLSKHPDLIIVNWAQCTQCLHWTHLRFCVRALDAPGDFLCPHCVPSVSRSRAKEE